MLRHRSTTTLPPQPLSPFNHHKPPKNATSPSAPKPPKAPQKPQTFTFHDFTLEDPYSWMSSLQDKVAMRHMDMYMEQKEKYTEAVLSDTERLQTKLQSEMASRLNSDLSTPPLRWGPWLYYRRAEEGKQYPVLCTRLACLNEEFLFHKSRGRGLSKSCLITIKKREIGGYAYEELSEISPDHKFLAYTIYDKVNDYFKLSVRNLNSGALCSKPDASRVSNLAWVKDGQALLYVIIDENKRPYRIYCSMIGSTNEDVLLLEKQDENVYVNIRHPKDFHFVTVNTFSLTSSKVFLINAADPFFGMTLVWESEVDVVQQQNMLHERTRILYGTALSSAIAEKSTNVKFSSMNDVKSKDDTLWNDLSGFYACEHLDVSSYDGAVVTLTIVYSQKNRKDNQSPRILDKRWRSELKSLLDRGWIVAYADVRRMKKPNSIRDYISCSKYVVEKEIVQENKLAGWGYSAGGLLVSFLDATNTLLYPFLPLTAADYKDFGYLGDIDDFHAIRKFSPYDNIQKDVLHPTVLFSSSVNTGFGVWEATKWVARVWEQTVYDPRHPMLLNLMTDIVEENRYLLGKNQFWRLHFFF
ncbi:hypothetical protein REPUB_Repub10bG0151600 [Reevesia pubescens]